MSTVTNGYGRYSVDAESYLASKGLSFGSSRKNADEAGNQTKEAGGADTVELSKTGLIMAAKARGQEELEGLSYEPMLTFSMEDGGTVSIEQAWEEIDGERVPTALRVVATSADGTEEVIYIDGALTAPVEEKAGKGPEETAEDGDESDAATEEEAGMTLMELIRSKGLDQVADASEGLYAAIMARIKAMTEASARTKEEQEALDELKAKHDSGDVEETAGETAPQTAAGESPAQTGMSRAYTRTGTAAASQAEIKTSGFSRSL